MLKRTLEHFHMCCSLGGGETFMLSSMPIWVRPEAVGLSVSQVQQ